MTSSKDIKYIFDQDVREKKRAGYGAFKRTGKGVKHGMRGIRFPSDSLTKAQKNKLNGEMYVVRGLGVKLTFEEFKQKSEEKQKEILIHWRNLYASKDIQEFMNIDKNVYYELLYKLEVIPRPNGKPAKVEIKATNSVLIEAIKNEVIPYEKFKLLSYVERNEILEDYQKKYTHQSIANAWGITSNNLYNVKYHTKKRLKEINDAALQKDTNENEAMKIEVVTNNEATNNVKNNEPTLFDEITEHDLIEQHEDNNNVDKPVNEPINVELSTNETINVGIPAATTNEPIFVNVPATYTKESNVVEAPSIAVQEFEAMRQLVTEQRQLIENFISIQQIQNAPIQQTQGTSQQIQSVSIQETQKTGGMEFSLVDKKEGFILHQDIKRLIAVLEKNPDVFEVEIKIRRKED